MKELDLDRYFQECAKAMTKAAQKGNRQMTIYGDKKHKWESQIAVSTDFPYLVDVGFTVGDGSGTVFLKPKEVVTLIKQLQTWLDLFHAGSVT